MQFLFACDISKLEEIRDSDFDEFWSLHRAARPVREFAIRLIKGAVRNLEAIDGTISKNAENYELGRIATVDRNILRLAIYEMQNESDIPPAVSINEAIEIAKRFGSEDSGRFVNGILDQVRRQLSKESQSN